MFARREVGLDHAESGRLGSKVVAGSRDATRLAASARAIIDHSASIPSA
jgi:hypothetical protein